MGLPFQRLRMKARGLTNQIASENFSRPVGGVRVSAPEIGITAHVVHWPSPPHQSPSRAAAHSRYPSQTYISLPLITQWTRWGAGPGSLDMAGIIRKLKVEGRRSKVVRVRLESVGMAKFRNALLAGGLLLVVTVGAAAVTPPPPPGPAHSRSCRSRRGPGRPSQSRGTVPRWATPAL